MEINTNGIVNALDKLTREHNYQAVFLLSTFAIRGGKKEIDFYTSAIESSIYFGKHELAVKLCEEAIDADMINLSIISNGIFAAGFLKGDKYFDLYKIGKNNGFKNEVIYINTMSIADNNKDYEKILLIYNDAKLAGKCLMPLARCALDAARKSKKHVLFNTIRKEIAQNKYQNECQLQ